MDDDGEGCRSAGGTGIHANHGARPTGLASPPKDEYLQGLGASDAFDYHVVPGGVDLLLDCAGAQTLNQGISAVRDGGRVISVIPPFGSLKLERGITVESFAAHVGRQRLEALSRIVDSGHLRVQVEAVLPLGQVREALGRVAGRHTRGKIVLQIGQ